ncbi:MAG TPA: tetratricopeptide repeat protein [Anaerolineae bacterium]|nr:tetratricopeptide repeat protein [Anaerolineae bacterium]
MSEASIYSSREVPSGTVTFLFTDIEGSTKLWQEFPAAMPAALARHHAILNQQIVAHHGYVFQVIGDAFHAVFASALDGLKAALAVQRTLLAETWGETGPIRVRMALHTDHAEVNADNYTSGEYGGGEYLFLARTARLLSAAHGGQILLSASTAALVREQLPPEIGLRDLGTHRVKDFQPQQVFQVSAPDLPSDFPPLKTLGSLPNNLPIQLTSFIGREREVQEVKDQLSGTRLMTLTGPGGSGKTRLALQVGAEVTEQFQDGVFFVALAAIRQPALVASTIAETLRIAESAGRSVLDTLKEYLHGKQLLLILDNFEQVISAAPVVVELLAAAPQLNVLVTSREGLRVRGEREYAVPPLAMPNLAELPSLAALSQYAAVELFIQRARAVKPGFNLTRETARTVAEICYRLDALPLAIELAAARVKFFTPQGILARLDHRLQFLTDGARDLPERQQTLRNTIAWSYDLLDAAEQELFRRLSVFIGGCTLAAAEAVVGDEHSLLDRIVSLLDKSLLRQSEHTDAEPRFVMLELLREFGLEQLKASGEDQTIRYKHANFFLALAEQAEARLESTEQIEWLDRMEQEHDNLRASLEWSQTAQGAGDVCTRLANMLGLFWEARGYFSEGRARLTAVLETDAAQGRTVARAKLLARAAELAYRQSDYPATLSLASESLAIYRQVGDKQGIASVLIKLGDAKTEVGDYTTASVLFEEALVIWHGLGDKHGTARALINLGWAALRLGNYPLANKRLEEALSIHRELKDVRGIGFALAGLGEVAARQGDYKSATRLVEESLTLRRQVGNKWGVGVALGTLAWIAMREDNWKQALMRLHESLQVRQEIGDRSGIAWCLERLAEIALARGQTEKSAHVFGAAAALRESIGSVIDSVDRPEYESKIATLRAQLGEERFVAAWEHGHRLAIEQAITSALEVK